MIHGFWYLIFRTVFDVGWYLPPQSTGTFQILLFWGTLTFFFCTPAAVTLFCPLLRVIHNGRKKKKKSITRGHNVTLNPSVLPCLPFSVSA